MISSSHRVFVKNVNVTDTILWQSHHDRVMQLNWLYFCGICQMMPLKVWPNTALGCNHQSICMAQLQLLRYPMYYPGGMKARVGPVQWSKPNSILAPTQDSNPGGRIQNHKRWPLHYHCTHIHFASRESTFSILISYANLSSTQTMLFHPNSNWHSSHLLVKISGLPKSESTSQISDRIQIWTQLAKF